MASTNTVAIIPVRTVPAAKHRLAPLLNSASRRNLVLAMLEDVLKAAKNASQINSIIVVSKDDEVKTVVYSRGHEIFTASIISLNEELYAATHFAEHQGANAITIVLADLPLLTGQVLDTIINQGREQASVVIAQDWRRNGTNVLYLCPPTAIQPHFGPGSFQNHIKAAQQAGLNPTCFDAPETALDLDDVEAIKRFLHYAAEYPLVRSTSTYQVLLPFIDELV